MVLVRKAQKVYALASTFCELVLWSRLKSVWINALAPMADCGLVIMEIAQSFPGGILPHRAQHPLKKFAHIPTLGRLAYA